MRSSGGWWGPGSPRRGWGRWCGVGIAKTLVFIVVAPLLGLGLGLCYMVLLAWLFRRATPRRIDRVFRRGQLLSAALYSLGHGGNDAQKTAGIIWGILAAANMLGDSTHIPFWVLLLCHLAMGLGTAFGGWRIVQTLGMRITKLKPVGGFAAETAGATTLALNAVAGIPVSTTHVITGAIVGVGATMKLSSVRWGIAGRIIWAWVLTIPAAAGVAIVLWYTLYGLGIAHR